MNNIFASKEMIDNLKKLPAAKSSSVMFGRLEFPVIESPLFPFEISYDACDIETRKEVKVMSGEWCHGAVVPKMDIPVEPLVLSFGNELKSYIDIKFRLQQEAYTMLGVSSKYFGQ